MQTIGLIGGITPQSTIMYYQVLNDLATKHFGNGHSCKVIINSVDFGEVLELQSAERWDLLEHIMANAGHSLEDAGAKCILICANTMHLTIKAVRNKVSIPVIHIAEATCEEIQNKKLEKVALLGTKYTMEKDFFKDILKNHGLNVLIPNQNDRTIIHDIIYEELSKGVLLPESKQAYLSIINTMIIEGADGIILGCTEIPLLIKQEDVSVPVFDTTAIHANKAFRTALNL